MEQPSGFSNGRADHLSGRSLGARSTRQREVMLTAPQRECLLYVQSHLAATGGVSPSVTEIATALETARSTAFSLMKQLEIRGHIRRLPDRARAIEVIKPVERFRVFRFNRETKELEPFS